MPQLLTWLSQHAPLAWLAWCTPFAICVLLTPLVIWGARRVGLVAKPREDRWHAAPTALFGGVAIFGACALALAVAGQRDLLLSRFGGALLGAAFMFAIGLWDDLRPLRPLNKLALQLVAAIGFGLWFYGQHRPDIVLLIPFAIVWVAGVTNALNLLDNMDGLSAGVGGICAFFLALHAVMSGDALLAILSFGVSGTCAGFLVWNFNPAKVFMGDCGSLFLGYGLACLSLMGQHGLLAGNFFSAIMLPALVLATPVFDTMFVSLARLGVGRSPAKGGRDHTSHRLVLMGLSERRAVVWLYGITVWFGLLSLWGASPGQAFATFAASAASILALLVFGGFLAEVQAYSLEELERAQHNKALGHARRLRPVARVGSDTALCACCLITAYLLKYDGNLDGSRGAELLFVLPLVVAAQIVCFILFGSYRRTWRNTSIGDVSTLTRGALVGTLVAYALSRIFPTVPYVPASLLAIDAALLLLGVGATRIGTKVLRHHFAVKWQKKANTEGSGQTMENEPNPRPLPS